MSKRRPAAPVYTFSDDFGGTLAKWGPNYRPSGLPRTQFDHALASVSGGLLHLKAERRADGLWYSSSLDTKLTFKQRYGLFAARIKVPKGKGLWPAGPWGYDDATSQEIDGMEIPQSGKAMADVHTLHCTVHMGAAWQSGAAIPTVDLSADFHVYAFDWRADHIAWLLDGAEVRRFTDAAHIPNVPLPVILDLGVSGWAGSPDATTPNPSEMLVDWVRAQA